MTDVSISSAGILQEWLQLIYTSAVLNASQIGFFSLFIPNKELMNCIQYGGFLNRKATREY